MAATAVLAPGLAAIRDSCLTAERRPSLRRVLCSPWPAHLPGKTAWCGIAHRSSGQRGAGPDPRYLSTPPSSRRGRASRPSPLQGGETTLRSVQRHLVTPSPPMGPVGPLLALPRRPPRGRCASSGSTLLAVTASRLSWVASCPPRHRRNPMGRADRAAGERPPSSGAGGRSRVVRRVHVSYRSSRKVSAPGQLVVRDPG